MSAFTFDPLTRALLQMKHDPETVDNLESLITERMGDAWDEGYARGVRDEAADIERADNPYRVLSTGVEEVAGDE